MQFCINLPDKCQATNLCPLKYILLLLFLYAFQKTHHAQHSVDTYIVADKQHSTFKKNAFHSLSDGYTLKRKFRPKKPKAVPVILLNIQSLCFRSVVHYADFKTQDILSLCSIQTSYAHGKRGPPFVQSNSPFLI